MKLVIFGGFVLLTGGIMWSLSEVASRLGGSTLDGVGPFLVILGLILGILGLCLPDEKKV